MRSKSASRGAEARSVGRAVTMTAIVGVRVLPLESASMIADHWSTVSFRGTLSGSNRKSWPGIATANKLEKHSKTSVDATYPAHWGDFPFHPFFTIPSDCSLKSRAAHASVMGSRHRSPFDCGLMVFSDRRVSSGKNRLYRVHCRGVVAANS